MKMISLLISVMHMHSGENASETCDSQAIIKAPPH
jgi:hypothetical protein